METNFFGLEVSSNYELLPDTVRAMFNNITNETPLGYNMT
jgi:hypothetical protein